jgi:hypothetical protein
MTIIIVIFLFIEQYRKVYSYNTMISGFKIITQSAQYKYCPFHEMDVHIM